MPIDRDKLTRLTEEDAHQFLIDVLRDMQTGKRRIAGGSYFDISATWVISQYLSDHRITEHNDKLAVESALGAKLLSAMWQLCLREILRPSVRHPGLGAQDGITGNSYSITERGRKWLKEGGEPHTLIASTSFLGLLQRLSTKFGPAYDERVVEAVKCYDAGAYLACCAMCGAACEAIYLSLAIAKEGDEHVVLKKYQSAQGRKEIKNIIERGLPGGLARALDSGFALLSHWRDSSAHGAASGLAQAEARSALSTLLSLAQLASDRWTDLTQKVPPVPTSS